MGCLQSNNITFEDLSGNIHKFTEDSILRHFSLATLPIVPEITPDTSVLLKESWKTIVHNVQFDYCEKAGYMYFYEQFFLRLNEISSRFDVQFPTIKIKGDVLCKVIKYLTSINYENQKEMKQKSINLGIYHREKDIRPWQYAVYIHVLLTTIAHCLGVNPKSEKYMLAWQNSAAFVLQYMLKTAIKRDSIIFNECVFTFSRTIFQDEELIKQIREDNKISNIISELTNRKQDCRGDNKWFGRNSMTILSPSELKTRIHEELNRRESNLSQVQLSPKLLDMLKKGSISSSSSSPDAKTRLVSPSKRLVTNTSKIVPLRKQNKVFPFDVVKP